MAFIANGTHMEIRKHKLATKPFLAKIHISKRIYTYKVGAQVVAIKTPNLMSTYVVPLNEFTGDPLAEEKSAHAQRSQWRCLDEFGCKWEGITPSQIKTWIIDHGI